MFVDLYFPPDLWKDRDEIEAAITTVLGDRGTVVGAGAGTKGVNIDLELFEDAMTNGSVDDVIATLRSLGAPGETLVGFGGTQGLRRLEDL